SGIMEQLADVPFEQLVEDDYVWVGTPDDIVERIAETRKICPGVSEIGITVNAGGAPHWMAIKKQEVSAARAGGFVIERVCVIGAGVIGSLFAGHLAEVAEVSVLPRREDHADALNRD